MGKKDWLFWGSGGGKSSKNKLGRSEAGGGAAGAERVAAAEVAAPPTGCMCAVLQLFDLHQFQFALHHQPSLRPAASFLHDEPCIASKGIEAPRNSLELDEPNLMESDSSSSSSTHCRKEQQNLNIPVAVSIQIKTTRENKSPRASSFSKKATETTMDDVFSDSCSSNSPAAGNKTPTLVARLMGLDQVPPQPQSSITPPPFSALNSQGLQSLRREHQHRHYSGLPGLQFLSQNRSCSNRSFFDNDIISAGSGTLSLPETPRISSARRSDVDHGHRLSLQINKENMGDEFEISTAAMNLARKRRQLVNKQVDEENRRRSSHYAREIVKQVKGSVGRKVGLDITNTIKRRDQRIRTDDDHVVLLKPKKPSKVIVTKVGHESVPSKQSTPFCSPRLLDPMNKPLSPKNQTSSYSPRQWYSPSPESQQSQQGKVHSTPKPQLVKLHEEQQNSVALKKGKKNGNEKYSSRIRKTPLVVDPISKKKEEPFIRPTPAHKGNNVTDKKCKKTPISNDLFNISVPTLLPVKKQSQASASATDGELWKRSTQMSNCSSQTYKLKQQQQQVTHRFNFQENNQDRRNRTTPSTPTSSADQVVELEYRHYIQRILKRAGIIDKATPVSLAKWYSPSHPLDPSVYHYIELFHPTISNTSTGAKDSSELNLKCNRKLVFQLVDELLADTLKPYLVGSRPSCYWPRDQIYGAELIDTLCSRIKKFPRADCKVLEDIDALIDADIGKSPSSWVHANEEEGEGIVEEIQREIMKSLVHETAMATRLQEVVYV